MKFGIREAVDVVFKTTKAYAGTATDFLLVPGQVWKKGEPVLYFDTLKMSTTEGTATSVYAQGGAGNPRLIAWEGDKTITFKFEDALISSEGMAILTGAGLVDASASSKVRAHRKYVADLSSSRIVYSNNNTATIDLGTYTASAGSHHVDQLATGESLYTTSDTDGEPVFGFALDSNGEILARIPTTYLGSNTASGVIYIGSNSYIGSNVSSILVDYYVEKTSGAKEISITPDKFAGYFYIEGETLFRRQSDGADLPALIIIPNAKIQTAFTFSMSPTGDPSTFEFTADAFPGNVKGGTTTDRVLYAIQVFES